MKKIISCTKEYILRTDKWLLLFCMMVSGVSLVLLLGILRSGYAPTLNFTRRNLQVQALAVGMGLVGAVILSNINYHALKKLWVLHLPISYLLVLLTFWIGVGVPARINDKRWLVLPVLDFWFQPAEILKISFILTFAYHIIKVSENMNRPVHLLSLCAHAGIPVLLIHFQGDDGTALLIFFIALSMLFFAGLSWKYIVAGLAGLAAAVPLLWRYVLDDFQKNRIMVLLDQANADPLGDYYQQYRAKIAIAKGGTTGIGLLGVEHQYVPEMHTDFIFTFLCESFGFMGALGLLTVMVALCLKILYNSYCAKDQYGSLLCIGVFGMLAFQFIINVGMCLSVLPVIGNTFPFLSYGGTSMLSCYLGIGLVLAVYLQKRRTLFSE